MLLALAVVTVWGTNFVVIKAALAHLPPLLFAALRFLLAFLPAAFFLKRPAVPWTHLAGFGLLIGAGQFGLLYSAINGHISPGLASLVVQMQVFFTIMLSVWLNGEHVRPVQWISLVLAASGVAVIALFTDGSATILGLVMILGAAASWSGGNLVVKRSGEVNMLAYVVWASVFAVPPLFLLSLAVEGWPAMRAGVENATAGTWAAVLWQSVGNTMFGYGVWGWLLARHPAATITPTALLVPVFGIGASALLLGESLPLWKLAAGGLVISGLGLNMLWPRLRSMVVARA
jgi:O-acetylserine/cysteine efflux transporter